MSIETFQIVGGIVVAYIAIRLVLTYVFEEEYVVSFNSMGVCGGCGVALRYTIDHSFSKMVSGMHFYCPACYKRVDQSDFGYNNNGVKEKYINSKSWGKYCWSNQPISSDLFDSHFSVKCFLPIRSESSDKKVLRKALVWKQKVNVVCEGVRRSPLPASSPDISHFF